MAKITIEEKNKRIPPYLGVELLRIALDASHGVPPFLRHLWMIKIHRDFVNILMHQNLGRTTESIMKELLLRSDDKGLGQYTDKYRELFKRFEEGIKKAKEEKNQQGAEE